MSVACLVCVQELEALRKAEAEKCRALVAGEGADAGTSADTDDGDDGDDGEVYTPRDYTNMWSVDVGY